MVKKTKAPLASLKLNRKKRVKLIQKIVASILSMGMALVVIYFGFNSTYFHIEGVDIVGNHFIQETEVRPLVEDMLKGSYVALVRKDNVYLYPESEIKKKLLSYFPRIKDVSFDNIGNNRLTVTLVERTSKALWCQNEESRDSCYFMDDTGYIFAKAPDISGNSFFIYYGKTSGVGPIGVSYLNSEEFKLLNTFVDELSQRSLSPRSLLVSPLGEVRIKLDGNSTLITTSDSDLSLVLQNIDAVIGEKTKNMSASVFFSGLEYMDTRFDNKVLLKKKEVATSTVN